MGGVPAKVVSVIKGIYNNFPVQVGDNNKRFKSFDIRTGVRQGCLPPPLLFLVITD